jgi:hypothetical protein
LVKPFIQVRPATLGLTPAGRKIEALRDKLGPESIATVEGAGPASTGGASSGGGGASGNPSGAQGLVDGGQGAGQPPANSANAANDCVGAAGEGLKNPSGHAESRGGRQRERAERARARAEVRELIREITRDVGWAPGLRVNSFRYENGVLVGESTEGDPATVINGSRGATIIIEDESADITTSHVYARNPIGVTRDRTQIAYGPNSSEPGTVQTILGPRNTITQTRPGGSPDSQPTEDASAGTACGEAAVRREQEEAERRNQPATLRFPDPGPNAPDLVIVEHKNPRRAMKPTT